MYIRRACVLFGVGGGGVGFGIGERCTAHCTVAWCTAYSMRVSPIGSIGVQAESHVDLVALHCFCFVCMLCCMLYACLFFRRMSES